MTIGVIVAEREEMMAIMDLPNFYGGPIDSKVPNLEFYKGHIKGIDVILCRSGVGKVNAARATQSLIDCYPNVEFIVNFGVAGGIDESLNIGDVVVGDKLIQYDFDATKVGDYEIGEICGLGSKYFCSNSKLVGAIMSLDLNIHMVKGLIGSADLFLSDKDRAERLNKEMGIMCVEMEGAAIAQVASLNKIPFVVIRGISDVQNDNNKVDFNSYLAIVSKQVACIFEEFLKNVI